MKSILLTILSGLLALHGNHAFHTLPPLRSRSLHMRIVHPKTIWKFSRPHTLLGTALCIPSLYLYAAPPHASWCSQKMLVSMLHALVCSGFINLFITGLNQLTDMEIDKVNKPTLPLVSGELSKEHALPILWTSLFCGFMLAFRSSSIYLQRVVSYSTLLGIIYSLPPIRLKRFPLLASLCIIVVRGIIINMGFYGHALHTVYADSLLSSYSLAHDLKCWLPTLYFSIFGLVIAIVKDIPDIQGDAMHKIHSLSVRFGATRMFTIGNNMILTLLKTTIMVVVLFTASSLTKLLVFWLGCMATAQVQQKARTVCLDSPPSIYSYYMLLWKVFYMSYLVLPFLR